MFDEAIEMILDMEIILYMEVKHHTVHRTTIGRRKQLCHRSYELYTRSPFAFSGIATTSEFCVQSLKHFHDKYKFRFVF